MSHHQISLKIVILGEGAVGKTSCIHRYIDNKFKNKYAPTIGVDILAHKIMLKDNEIHFQFWDIGGQKHYKKIREKFYRNTAFAILIYDVTNKTSFEKLDEWIKDCIENSGLDVPMILVGNKIDLSDQRKISTDQVKEFQKNNQKYIKKVFETSALTGENIEEAFQSIGEMVLS